MALPTSSSITLVGSSPTLHPVTPIQSSRYDFVQGSSQFTTVQRMVPSGPWKHGNKELDRKMHALGDLPKGWTQYVHLDGKPYFHHPGWGVVTEAYIWNPTVYAMLEAWYHKVKDAQSKKPPHLATGREEIYLTLQPREAYYFVDHDSQSVFWLEDIPLEQLGYDYDGHNPAKSFGLFMEENYYSHLENFPIHNQLPLGAEDFLRDALAHACTDHITSRDSSTAPWNAEHCKTFLELLDTVTTSTTPGYKTWFVSRLLCNILNSRWVHHYGMFEAHTDRLASVKALRPHSRLLCLGDFISGTLLFYAPFTYLERLEELWADKIVSLNDWRTLLTSLLVEWSDSNLLATVTLSANMALLAINPMNSAARVFSLVSVLFAIGSIVIGLHHVWRHRVKVDTDAQQATTYLINSTNRFSSLKGLAFFLSLPLVLLSWSIVTFACSITLYIFLDSPWWWYIPIGFALCLVIGVIFLTTLFFWGIFSPR